MKSSEETASTPLIVTLILPVVAPTGTVTTSVVDVADIIDASLPLNSTVLSAMLVLKFVPVIVTVVPAAPEVGVNEVIVSGISTVKSVAEVTITPSTVTVNFPEVAPDGTVVISRVGVASLTAEGIPLNFTVFETRSSLKFVPVIVICVSL